MTRMIFINLPVADLPRARGFYEAIGARNEPRFTDETAACMVFSETIHVMLLTHAKFRGFSPLPVADAHATAQVLLAISAADRAAVDAMTDAAARHGGRADVAAKQDYGFMYSRSFADPDGHVWEPMWMDVAAFDQAPGQAKPA